MPNAPSNRRASTSRTPLPQGSEASRRGQRQGGRARASQPRPTGARPQGIARRISMNEHIRRSNMRENRIEVYFEPVAPPPNSGIALTRNAGSPPTPPPPQNAGEGPFAHGALILHQLGLPLALALMGDEEPGEFMELELDGIDILDFLQDGILSGFEPRPPEGGVRTDYESVMERGRREATYRAVYKLRQAFPEPYDLQTVLHFFLDELHGMEAGTAPVPAPLQHTRLGVSEVKNARRTLTERGDEDRTPPLCLNPPFSIGEYGSIRLGDLLALVWTALLRLDVSPADREGMTSGVYRALAECIEVEVSETRQDGESDGDYQRRMQAESFRACPLGIAERLVSVLEGHCDAVQNLTMRAPKAGQEEMPRCTTGQLLSEFCRELRHKFGEATPSDAELNKLYEEALTRASQFWVPGVPLGQWASFKKQLREWLEGDYEPWKAPA